MTKIRKYTIPSAAALAVAAGLGLATAPAQAAAIVKYFDGSNFLSGSILLSQLFNPGAFISVDENGDGTVEKLFSDWTFDDFTTNPTGLLPNPASNIQVSATGTFGPGFGSSTLSHTVLNNALSISNTTTANRTVDLNFSFEVTSAGNLPIVQQIDAITGASVSGPTTGTLSSVTLNGATFSGSGSIPPNLPVTNDDSSPGLPGVNTLSVSNNVSLLARRISATVPGSANLTSFSQTFTQVAIPEPGTVAGILAVGGLGLAMKRRQKDS
jgi:hypothetical protein